MVLRLSLFFCSSNNLGLPFLIRMHGNVKIKRKWNYGEILKSQFINVIHLPENFQLKNEILKAILFYLSLSAFKYVSSLFSWKIYDG